MPKKFYLLVETDQLPICNQSTGAKNLFVDEVLSRTEREIEMEPYKPTFPWLFIVLVVLFVIAVIAILTRYTT